MEELTIIGGIRDGKLSEERNDCYMTDWQTRWTDKQSEQDGWLNRGSETADGWWTWNKGTDNKIKAGRTGKDETGDRCDRKKFRWFKSDELINQSEINGRTNRINEREDDGEKFTQVEGDDGKSKRVMSVVLLKHYGTPSETKKREKSRFRLWLKEQIRQKDELSLYNQHQETGEGINPIHYRQR